MQNTGLLISKIEDDICGKLNRLRAANIGLTNVICSSLPLRTPKNWDSARAKLNAILDEDTIDVAELTGLGLIADFGR